MFFKIKPAMEGNHIFLSVRSNFIQGHYRFSFSYKRKLAVKPTFLLLFWSIFVEKMLETILS